MSNNNEQKKSKLKNIHAVYMGKRSAEARKKIGHNKEYYRQLALKRWGKT